MDISVINSPTPQTNCHASATHNILTILPNSTRDVRMIFFKKYHDQHHSTSTLTFSAIPASPIMVGRRQNEDRENIDALHANCGIDKG